MTQRAVEFLARIRTALFTILLCVSVTKVAHTQGIVPVPGSGSMTDVTSTYTSSGAISLTDSVSMLNSGSALTMTIANGSSAVLQLTIHNIGAGTATVSGTIEGGANSVTLLGNPNGADLVLRWLPSLSTWIVI